MQAKSSLNPHATPYVPQFSCGPAGWQKPADKLHGESENKEDVVLPAELQLPDSPSVDCEVQSFEKLSVSGEPSSKICQKDSYDEFSLDEFAGFDDQYLMNDLQLELEYLSSIFPEISVESLAEFLSAHGDDLNVTTDVLHQLQYDYDCDLFETSFQAAETGTSSTMKGNK